MKPGAGMVTEGVAIFFGFGFRKKEEEERKERNEVK